MRVSNHPAVWICGSVSLAEFYHGWTEYFTAPPAVFVLRPPCSPGSAPKALWLDRLTKILRAIIVAALFQRGPSARARL